MPEITEKENKGYYSRSILKWDLIGLRQKYNVTVHYISDKKHFELRLNNRAFAVARDIRELYHIISSLNQFRIYDRSYPHVRINGKKLDELNNEVS